MANNTLVSKIDGKWVHDASSLHGMSVSGTTLYLDWGNSNSAYHKQTTLSINVDALVYRGTWTPQSDYPSNPVKGDTYKVSAAGEKDNVKYEIGDMIIYNGTSWDAIQANIDPTMYARLTHTHSATLSGGISNTSITPKGTISVSVSGANSTFTGSFTPSGTVSTAINETLTHNHTVSIGTSSNISIVVPNANTDDAGGNAITIDSHIYTPAGNVVGTLSTESVNLLADHTLTFTGTGHSHTFTGTEGQISVDYVKAATVTGEKGASVTGTITLKDYTPEGSVSVALGFDEENATINNTLAVDNHSHSFTGSPTTFTGSYTPVGTIDVSVSNTLASTSINYATGNIKSTTTDSAIKSLTLASVGVNSLIQQNVATVSRIDVSYVAADEELKHIVTNFEAVRSIDASTTKVITGITTGTFAALKSVVLTTSSFTNITNVTASVTNAAFNGTADTITVSGTPQGSTGNTQPSLTGSITAKYSKAKVTSASFNGTAKAPDVLTLSLTAANHTHSVGTSSSTATGLFTPVGTIGSTTAGGSITGPITYSYIKATGITAAFEGTVYTLSHGTVTMPNHHHSIGTSSDTRTVNITIEGTTENAEPSINKTFSGTFKGTADTVTVSGTPQLGTPTGTFYGKEENHNHDNTLTVNVSKPVDANA